MANCNKLDPSPACSNQAIAARIWSCLATSLDIADSCSHIGGESVFRLELEIANRIGGPSYAFFIGGQQSFASELAERFEHPDAQFAIGSVRAFKQVLVDQ